MGWTKDKVKHPTGSIHHREDPSSGPRGVYEIHRSGVHPPKYPRLDENSLGALRKSQHGRGRLPPRLRAPSTQEVAENARPAQTVTKAERPGPH